MKKEIIMTTVRERNGAGIERSIKGSYPMKGNCLSGYHCRTGHPKGLVDF